MGLGHVDGQHKLVSTPMARTCCRAHASGAAHNLPPMHALAFAVGTHAQLRSAAPTVAALGGGNRRSQRQQGKAPAAADNGDDCGYVTMPGELVQ